MKTLETRNIFTSPLFNRAFFVNTLQVTIFAMFFLANAITVRAQYVSSASGGEWSVAGTWTGAVPPYTNISNDVTINSYVTSNQSISFNTLGSTRDDFTINDTLIIYGNLSLGLDDDLTVNPGAVLIIFGNFSAVNQVNIGNGGYFVVLGDFTMAGGTSSYNNTGDGQTYITGTVTVPGGGGDVSDLECDPDYPPCGYGDINDLLEDPIWDFIDEIDDGVSCSLTASGIVTNESSSGAGDGAIDLTITSSGNPDVEWYFNGTLYSIALNITDLNNDGDISGLDAGDYNVYITEGFCSVSLSFTVSVACTPPTISGTTPDSICGSGEVVLGASSTGTINWYDDLGNLVGTGTSFTTPTIITTTTYYVDATDAGCTTPTRTPVVAKVNPLPTAIITVALDVICDGEFPVINIDFTTPSTEWDLAIDDGINPIENVNVQAINDPYDYIPVTNPQWIDDGSPDTEYVYSIEITDSKGCVNTYNSPTITVYKIPETGPQYHIPILYGQ